MNELLGDIMKHWAFFLGLGALFTHELDAVANHEWRVLPLIRALPEDSGAFLFIMAHLPIFALVVALVASPDAKIQLRSRVALSLFLIIHGILHTLFMNHPAYEFSSTLSNILIFGGSIFGATHLMFEVRDRNAMAA